MYTAGKIHQENKPIDIFSMLTGELKKSEFRETT